jgi:hypothetical protein
MYNWNKVFSEHKFEYLLKNTQYLQKISVETFIFVSDLLMDDFIHTFGLQKQFKRMQQMKVKAAKLKLKFIQTNDLRLINQISVLDAEIDGLKAQMHSGSKDSFDKQLVSLEKWFGQPIDLHKTTVKKFHAIVENYVAANKKR